MRSALYRAVLLAAVLFLGIHAIAAAIEVDRSELEKGGSKRIVFINYEGPYARIESAEDILGIGLALGRAIKAGARTAGSPNRYYVTHAVGAAGTSPDTLDADVFSLGVDVGVDHIKNLRLIMRGFLQGAYDYAPKDAAVLAEFVTVYNAVYRGDWTYISSRYRQGVIANLVKERAGLSVRFDEWPGRAMILIPLIDGAKPGSLSAVDTSSLTEKAVVEQLRTEADQGVDSRKEMVDLKEREAAESKQKAELEREAIVEEEKKLAEEKAALQAEQDRLAAEERKAAEAKQAGADKETIAAAEKAVEEQRAVVEKKEEEVAAREESIAEKKEEAEKAEAFAEKKEAEAAAERKTIADDQQAAIKKEEAAAQAGPAGALSLAMVTRDGPMARLVRYDVTTDRELKSSTLDTIRSRSVLVQGDTIIAVAGRSGGNGAIRLVQIDGATLEMRKQGMDDMHPESPLWEQGTDIYALIVLDGKPRLARFDRDLVLKNRSASAIHPYATIDFIDGYILTQGEDGAPLALKAVDLSDK